MTNTRITDAEVFERRYPVILRKFGLRRNSGGGGQHRGGDGVVRDIEFRIPLQVSILSERRVFQPYGMEGGEPGYKGLNVWVKKVQRVEGADADDDADAYRQVSLGGKNTAAMKSGERIIIATHGGGGWGPIGKASEKVIKDDPKMAWRGGSIAMRQSEAESSA